MKAPEQPLVSVLIPVYNGEQYLSGCLESVLTQTYGNWECIISDNCSTDGTAEIARRYVQEDQRIRLFTTKEFVSATRNHNLVCGLMSPLSSYCKMLHADDDLFPECLEKMVELAEKHPKVGIVGSYVRYGDELRCNRIPREKPVVPGKEVCKAAFMGEYTVFATPSALMIRSELFRDREALYDESLLYCDIDACFRILSQWDFGCVHQILSRVRVHENSNSARLDKKADRAVLEIMGMVFKHAPNICTESEYRKVLNYRLKWYYESLARNVFLLRGKGVVNGQLQALKKWGVGFQPSKLVIGMFSWLMHGTFKLGRRLMRVGRVEASN